jgi:hypothetical protein
MVKLTPEHWDAVQMRANGNTYSTIALEQGCTVDEARQRVEQVSRVMALQLASEQGGNDGEDDGS